MKADERDGKWWASVSEDGPYKGPHETKEEAVEIAAENLWPHDGTVYVGIGVYPSPKEFACVSMEVLIAEMEASVDESWTDIQFCPISGAREALQATLEKWAEEYIAVDMCTVKDVEEIKIPEDRAFLRKLNESCP